MFVFLCYLDFFEAFFALRQRSAIAFCAISLRRSGVSAAARFFASATAAGSFFFSMFYILPQELQAQVGTSPHTEKPNHISTCARNTNASMLDLVPGTASGFSLCLPDH